MCCLINYWGLFQEYICDVKRQFATHADTKRVTAPSLALLYLLKPPGDAAAPPKSLSIQRQTSSSDNLSELLFNLTTFKLKLKLFQVY